MKEQKASNTAVPWFRVLPSRSDENVALKDARFNSNTNTTIGLSTYEGQQ
jgi:hypothetical protein